MTIIKDTQSFGKYNMCIVAKARTSLSEVCKADQLLLTLDCNDKRRV